MKYSAEAFGCGAELSVEKEGLRIGGRFLDFADFLKIRPINHRVYVDLLGGETVEISMLGFSYDGFLEELCDCYSKRGMEALFAHEQPIMRCEGEYRLADEQGRGIIVLLSDAVCILPMTSRAVRIPLCFTREIRLDGYLLQITMLSGAAYTVGRMGYDTMPFAERAQKAADITKKQRGRSPRWKYSRRIPSADCSGQRNRGCIGRRRSKTDAVRSSCTQAMTPRPIFTASQNQRSNFCRR